MRGIPMTSVAPIGSGLVQDDDAIAADSVTGGRVPAAALPARCPGGRTYRRIDMARVAVIVITVVVLACVFSTWAVVGACYCQVPTLP